MNDDIKNLWKIDTELLSKLKGKVITIDETDESGGIEKKIFQHRQHVVDTTNELIKRNLRLLGWTHKDDQKIFNPKSFKDVIEEKIRQFKALNETYPTIIFASLGTINEFIRPEFSVGDCLKFDFRKRDVARFCGLVVDECPIVTNGCFVLYNEHDDIKMEFKCI